jgi:hypothetical protein
MRIFRLYGCRDQASKVWHEQDSTARPIQETCWLTGIAAALLYATLMVLCSM